MPLFLPGWITVFIYMLGLANPLCPIYSKFKMQQPDCSLSVECTTSLQFYKLCTRLPVRHRTDFKTLLIEYKSVNGIAPFYLSDLFIEHFPTRSLQSIQPETVVIPMLKYKCRPWPCFLCNCPQTLVLLTHHYHLLPLSVFKSSLKTYLFDKAYNLY